MGKGMQWSRVAASAAGAALLTVGWPAGCSPDKPPPETVKPELTPNPMPRFLRGTIIYEAQLLGYGQTLVQGYGIVVGLDGTGSNDTPLPVRTYLEREGAKLLPDPEVSGAPRLTMRGVLDDRNTAAVLVQAAVPPGAVKGSRFDVVVSAVPGSSTTSLEGGRLWTANLTTGFLGAVQGVQPVAQARGDLFINPFAGENLAALAEGVEWSLAPEESAHSEAPDDPSTGVVVDRRVGRILNGGVVTTDLPLVLQLRTPNYSRARAIIDAINTRFPQEPSQPRPTAESVPGRSDEQIVLTVPPSRHEQTDAFVETLMYTQIFQGGIELRADQLARWVVENPVDAPAVTWCWVALGELAVGAIGHLYTHPDVIPRLAALNAGARLGDPRVVPHLIDMARDRASGLRIDAIRRLSEMPPSAQSALALRELLDDEQFDVRVAAFNALLKQREPIVRRVTLDPHQEFDVYAVPSQKPMVYATLQKQPRIVVFGSGTGVAERVLVRSLSDRLQLVRHDQSEPLRARYRKKGSFEAIEYEPPTDMVGFVSFLGARPSAYSLDPALGLSYGETVRVLYEMQVQRGLNTVFAPERNTLIDDVVRGIRAATPEERPESRRDPSLREPDSSDPPAESTIRDR